MNCFLKPPQKGDHERKRVLPDQAEGLDDQFEKIKTKQSGVHELFSEATPKKAITSESE
jgi:hypothetical protein